MRDLALPAGVQRDEPFARLLRPIDRATEAANLLSALCLLVIFVLVGAEIVSRNVLNRSIPFSWDVSAFLMGACFMLAAASALKEGSHVRVSGVADAMSPRGSRILDGVAAVVGLAITAVLTAALTEMAWLSFQRGSTSASVVRIPLAVPQAVLAAGSLLLTLQIVAQLLRVIGGARLARGEGIE